MGSEARTGPAVALQPLSRLVIAADRFGDTVEAWLSHRYSTTLGLLAAALLVNEIVVLGPHPADWDPLLITGAFSFVVVLHLAVSLPERCDTLLRRLHQRGVLAVDATQLTRFRERLHAGARTYARVGGWVLGGIVLGCFVLAYRGAGRSETALTAVGTICGYLAGRAAGRAVAYGRLGTWLAALGHPPTPLPGHIDGAAGLAPVGRFYAAQARLAAAPAAFFAAWWFLIPVLDRYRYWRQPFLVLLAAALVVQLLAFALPLLAFSRRMREEKERLLDEADAISATLHALRWRPRRDATAAPGAVDAAEDEDEDELTARYEALTSMPTWPVDVPTRRRFEARNAVLLLPLLAKAAGVAPAWQDVLDGVGRILAP